MSQAINLQQYTQHGLTIAYFDKLFNREISFGSHVFRQWLKPGAGSQYSYKCGAFGWFTCYANNAGWVDLGKADVRFGISGLGKHTKNDEKHTAGNITSYVTINTGNSSTVDVLARNWGNGGEEDPKKDRDTIDMLVAAAESSNDDPIRVYNPVRSSDHQYTNNGFDLKLDYSKVNTNGIRIKPIDGTLKRTTTIASIKPGDFAKNP